MTCKCNERADELAKAGVQPLIGGEYTAVDAAQWAVFKIKHLLMGKLGT